MIHNKKENEHTAEEQINSISNLFSVLSNPTRIKILWFLKKEKSLNVHELQNKLHISQSNVSQHLSLLKLNKLVSEERKGKEVYYNLLAPKKTSKVMASAMHLITYQLAANSELLSSAELLSLWL